MEEFILRCLDVLNDDVFVRKEYLSNYYDETNFLVETAVEFKRKKVIMQNRVQRGIKLINGNLLTTYIDLLSAEKMELGNGPLEKLWNGGGLGNFLAAGIFFVIKFLV